MVNRPANRIEGILNVGKTMVRMLSATPHVQEVSQMGVHQKVLFVDAATGYYRMGRYELGDFFGRVNLGLHLAGKHNSLNIGTGLLAGSVFPGRTG